VVTPRVVVVGDLTIDDVVLPDGTTEMGSIGGDSLYAALGARLWEPCVGIVTRRGDDFPRRQLDGLASLGIGLEGVVDIPGPTVRNWVIYEADGRRHWVYRTAPGRSVDVAVHPEDIPSHWLSAQPAPVLHVAAMPISAAVRIVEAVRGAAPTAIITLDTHEDYVRGYQEQLLRLAKLVDVFLPSREELADLLGYDDPPRALAQLSREMGLHRVVVKAGKDGALVWDQLRSAAVTVEAVATRVVDVTGAGDAFCGGLAAGLANGQDLIQAARRGAVSAAFATEGFGSLALASVSPARATARLTGSPQAGLKDPFAIELMRDEIRSAPEVVGNLLAAAGPVAALAKSLAESGVDNIYMVGCGDSYLAGAAAALAFARHTGIAAEAVHALDMARYRVRYLPPNSAVLCVSSSGEVGRTIEAAAQARAFGHRAIALTANASSRLTKEATDVIPLDFPSLGSTPGTISFLAMLVTLFDLSLRWGEARGHDVAPARALLDRAPQLLAQTIASSDGPAERLAERLRHRTEITFIGAGPNEATARFGAAKLFESAQVHGVATNLEEWAHGEYFVTRDGHPVVVVAPGGVTADRAAEILAELAFINADTTLVSDAPPAKTAATVIPIAAGLPEEFSPLLAAVPLSLLAFYLARDRGKRSYNFPSPAAANEHYETIHRDTRGRPA
jgi:fructoselysine-6-P-deglycase FrlB-like protein/sugar/nucleoside kinase (ribokinase family)